MAERKYLTTTTTTPPKQKEKMLAVTHSAERSVHNKLVQTRVAWQKGFTEEREYRASQEANKEHQQATSAVVTVMWKHQHHGRRNRSKSAFLP